MKKNSIYKFKTDFGIGKKLNINIFIIGLVLTIFLNGIGNIVYAQENNNSVSTNTSQNQIEEGSVRLHFENIDPNNPESYGLWIWGGVETPSEKVGNWPDGATKFSNDKKDDYGYYIDIKKSSSPADINYLLLRDGQKVTEQDQSIRLMFPEQNEVWILNNTTYHYEPLKDPNVLRINYKRDDNNYENWGVWTWGDTSDPSDGTQWPNDAIDFKVGKYGAYVDVPLSQGLNSNLNFLLVNQSDPDSPGNKTINLSFSERNIHSNIFMLNDETKIYTNPYFDGKVKPEKNETPGTKNIIVTASLKSPFNYNESGLVTVNIDNPNNVKITKMEIDTSAIGGGIIPISPELNRVTIKATSNILPGEYDLPVKVYDAENNYYETILKANITERLKKDGEKDWDEQVIYFMVTDRFYNGDKSNDKIAKENPINPRGLYRGGDFKGVTAKLDYLERLGVDAIWLTPIVENVTDDFGNNTNGEYYAYHGYWASDFENINQYLGTLDDFHELIDKAAEKGINIIVDVVLNHSGYGTEAKFSDMVRSKEEGLVNDDQLGSLSGLPDFKTENAQVRNKLVEWQSSWIDRSKTAKGNSIYAFRVDTVKHVDDTTWQHFKNELVAKDPDFHLIGETWGANYKDTKGDLGIGTMDSLLDFGFKDIAKRLINNELETVSREMKDRNDALNSAFSLGQFLGSHDENGFLYSIGGADDNANLDKLKLAASLLLTAKGSPVIYYGEELGQSGENNWPIYSNRYDFDWDRVNNSDILNHYQKLLAFRNSNSLILSRGDIETIAANDNQKFYLAKRSYEGENAYLVFSTNKEEKQIAIEVSNKDVVLTDFYTNKTYNAVEKEGKWVVETNLSTISQGGTMLLKAQNGDITGVNLPEIKDDPIESGYFRIHFKKLPSDDINSLGLWIWNDVETPSEKVGSWPVGATRFTDAKKDDYGYYLDIKMKDENADKISFLINNINNSSNLTDDKNVERISKKMNEIWLDENYNINLYEPLKPGYIRINYFRSDNNYANKGLWVWGDVKDVNLTNFPDGINFEKMGEYGTYIDVKLNELPESIGFLLLDETKQGDDAKIQAKDYVFKELKNQTQIFLKDDDPTIYTNPYFVNHIRAKGVEHIDLSYLEATFTTLDGASKESILNKLSVTDKNGVRIDIRDIELDSINNKVKIFGDFNYENSFYVLKYGEDSFKTNIHWKLKDKLFAYDGELGSRISQEGSVVDMTIWSPSADRVDVVIYDKDDQNRVVGELEMIKGDKGQWDLKLTDQSNLGISDYRGYYYHYKITRNGESVLVLDPYAKSLAEWNSELADQDKSYKVAKAAFVDPKEVGPSDLSHANIPNFKQREDAIIYEAHVRDFTSDPAIANELKTQFGTFSAFSEKLSYLKDLGVTHIQLLPVMSYYYVNESENSKRLEEYASSNSNYNWGYDPQSYFALTGMYSSDPKNPIKRIEEFKNLVNEIHKQGMGVILDVVYNHTAKTFIFEDLEPNYYHFMTADGIAKTSFGGGRLGTTHHMSRRVLIDSIKYLVDEFKVDGFRFDMMGDHDAESIEMAFNEAKKINPNIIMLGEGWRTFTGDENDLVKAADQDWMKSTDTVAVFSDDIRNTLKSGYPNEGTPAFITGGSRNIYNLFNNIKAQPTNFLADDPGDVIQYIAAHDNLTLFDIIAQSIKKDPSIANNYSEIHKRQRLGNLLILTAQGTPFIHSGQEYGRTKQFLHPDYNQVVTSDKVPNKSHLLVDQNNVPFSYPYYIHDSYDSSDAVNKFDWSKATNTNLYPENTTTQLFTKGLIKLRKSTDAFSLKNKEEVDKMVSLITVPGENGVENNDLVIAYQVISTNGERYGVFVNADSKERNFVLNDYYKPLLKGDVLVDGKHAGIEKLKDLVGVTLNDNSVTLAPLTATVIRLNYSEVPSVAPSANLKPELNITTVTRTVASDLPIVEEIRYDNNMENNQSYILQNGEAEKEIIVYQDVFYQGKVIATNVISTRKIQGQNRIIVKGTKSVSDTSISSNTTTKPTLPKTGTEKTINNLFVYGLIGIAVILLEKVRRKV